MIDNKSFSLRLYSDLKERCYKQAFDDDKSINETLNRFVSHALNSEVVYFEMQFLKVGERFKFKKKKNQRVYRLEEIVINEKIIVRDIETKKVFELNFSQYFSKLIFCI